MGHGAGHAAVELVVVLGWLVVDLVEIWVFAEVALGYLDGVGDFWEGGELCCFRLMGESGFFLREIN